MVTQKVPNLWPGRSIVLWSGRIWQDGHRVKIIRFAIDAQKLDALAAAVPTPPQNYLELLEMAHGIEGKAETGNDQKRFDIGRLGISVALPADWRDNTVDFGECNATPHVVFIPPPGPRGMNVVPVYFKMEMEDEGMPTSLDLKSTANPSATVSEIIDVAGTKARLTGARLPGPGDAENVTLQICQGTRMYTGDFIYPHSRRAMYLPIIRNLAKSIRFLSAATQPVAPVQK
jgi:hypothetical protein